MERKRYNRVAICSSDNYRKSRLLHNEYLKEQHSHFKELTINGEISFDMPYKKNKFKKVRIFGKDMVLTIDEYNIHCKSLGL